MKRCNDCGSAIEDFDEFYCSECGSVLCSKCYEYNIIGLCEDCSRSSDEI